MEPRRSNDPERPTRRPETRPTLAEHHETRAPRPRGSDGEPRAAPAPDAGIASALLLVTLELRHARHHLADEHARRTFFDVGFAALCRQGHPVRRTGEDHLALYQLLDWPRAHGRTIAEEVLRALERRRSARPAGTAGAMDAVDAEDTVDAGLVQSFTRARLMLVRTTSRAGERLGLEDLATGRMLRGWVPECFDVGVGDTLLTRFAETRVGLHVPIADLLVVPDEALREFEVHRRDPEGPTGPNLRSTEAARLFRAWTLVAFGDEAGVIDPSDHVGGEHVEGGHPPGRWE